MARKRNPTATAPDGKLIITVNIDPDQVRSLDDLADVRRTSRSHLVREAIDLFLATNIARGNIAVANRRESADVA